MSDFEDDEIPASQQIAMRAAKATDPVDKFNVDADRIFLNGVEQFPDFENSVEVLKSAGVMSQDVILQAMELDNPAKVFDELAKDVDLAKQVASLSPVRRAAALAAISTGQPIPTTNATPSWKRSRNDLSREDISDKAWAAAYDKRYGLGGLPGRGR
jgi:hypothetical protein